MMDSRAIPSFLYTTVHSQQKKAASFQLFMLPL